MIQALFATVALAALDPCAPIEPAPAPDAAAAAEYRSVAEAEETAGKQETAVIAWRTAAALDPGDRTAPAALARLCREGGASAGATRDPLGEGIRLLDRGRYREAAELLRGAQGASASSDAALLEGISRYELGEDAEAARLLRLAEADPAHRATARLYLGLLALREGSAREAATLFDEASASPAIAPFASDLSRSARWEGPLLLSLMAEGGYDSNVSLTSQGVGPAMAGDATAGVSALAIGRPFGTNGLFVRAGGVAQQYARLDRYDFNLLEGAAGWRWWRGGSGVTAEYAFAERTLGGDHYLATNRLLASGAFGLGPVAMSGAWQGRWENYASTWDRWSGFAQRADGRASVALGARARVGVGWIWGNDDTDDPGLAWREQGPRADLRVAVGARTRLGFEVGGAVRQYRRNDPSLLSSGGRQRDVIVDGTAALEVDLNPRTTLRFGLQVRRSNSNVAGFDYTKVVPTAGIGVMMTP